LTSVDIIIPNLVPGKRYRMVVETANSAGQINVGSTSVPSIEFVVPSANQLLSEYTPTYSVKVDNYPATNGKLLRNDPIYGADPDPVTTTTTVAKSKKCNNTPTIRASNLSNPGWYVFRFDSLSGVPPVKQVFYVSGMGKSSPSWYYDFLEYTCESHTSNNNIVATAKILNELSWNKAPKGTSTVQQSKDTRDRWRDQKGKPFNGIETDQGTPTLSWRETTSTTVDESAPIVGYTPVYETIAEYSVTTVTVSVPNSLKLENNSQNNQRVVEIPVFFYIQNGIFYNLDNTVMSGLPPVMTTVPSTIPRTGTNTNAANVGVSQRSYRFTVAKYTQINGLWEASWSQSDDLYESEKVMKHVIYSRQAVL
jgi:hypothetical protein